MMPIAPLMIEHRLIERMIGVMKKELVRSEKEKKIEPKFIEMVVDFIRTYADHCHHGKEENILFRDLNKKELTHEHKQIMEALIEEHRWGRGTTKKLVEAKERYIQDEGETIPVIVDCMRSLIEFYPRHIEKEDKYFFIPCMRYFTDEEKDAMLKEEWEFDRNFVHEKYRKIVANAEEKK
jgi:hemerythrin-like domain-containing protein